MATSRILMPMQCGEIKRFYKSASLFNDSDEQSSATPELSSNGGCFQRHSLAKRAAYALDCLCLSALAALGVQLLTQD
jgi:hypothetical protein